MSALSVLRTAEGTVRDSRQVGQWKLRSVSPRGARSVAVLVPAEYLILSEGGRNCRIECRSARSGRPSALLDAAESCGTSRGCSRRSHGDAAVPVDDPTPEHVPLWFRDFDAPRGNERPSGHVSLFPRPSALCSEGGSRCCTAPVSSRSSSSISRPNATVSKPPPARRSMSEPDTRP